LVSCWQLVSLCPTLQLITDTIDGLVQNLGAHLLPVSGPTHFLTNLDCYAALREHMKKRDSKELSDYTIDYHFFSVGAGVYRTSRNL